MNTTAKLHMSLQYSQSDMVFVGENVEHEVGISQVVKELDTVEKAYIVRLTGPDGKGYTMIAAAEQLVSFRDNHEGCLAAVQEFLGDMPILEGFTVTK